MIRLAQHTDIPRLVEMMLELKQHTGWKHVQHPGYGADPLARFMAARLLDERSVVYVSDVRGHVVAFCGCQVSQLPWPPLSPTLMEWGWFGPAKDAAKCWRACVNWGKKHHHVEYACRVSARPIGTRTRVTECVTWEVL